MKLSFSSSKRNQTPLYACIACILRSQQAGKTLAQKGPDPQWLLGRHGPGGFLLLGGRPGSGLETERQGSVPASNQQGSLPGTRQLRGWRLAYVPPAVEACQSLATQFQMGTLSPRMSNFVYSPWHGITLNYFRDKH